MLRILMLFLFGVFFIYISVCSYKYIRYGKTHKIILRFMTSCMIIFTFIIVLYNDVFLNDSNGRYGEVSVRNESKVFLSSLYNEPEDKNDEYEKVNEQGIKITAYFDNANPARGSITNLIVTGPKGAKVTAICQYKGHGNPYLMDIGSGGIAVIPIKVENDAEPGLLVVVDITVSFESKQYKINSVFTPQ